MHVHGVSHSSLNSTTEPNTLPSTSKVKSRKPRNTTRNKRTRVVEDSDSDEEDNVKHTAKKRKRVSKVKKSSANVRKKLVKRKQAPPSKKSAVKEKPKPIRSSTRIRNLRNKVENDPSSKNKK